MQDEIILQHGRDILRCDGAHGLQPSLTSKLATVFQAGGESKEVRTRAGLYYRASLHTIALLKRGETVRSVRADCLTVRLWAEAEAEVSAAQMKEMKETAIQFLGVEEAEENMEIQENNNTKTEIIRSVATATTQTEAEDLLLRSQGSEENTAKIITSVATQTKTEEGSLRKSWVTKSTS